MLYFDMPWAYLFAGLVLGIGGTLGVTWLRAKNISVKWYDWIIGVIGLLLFLFALQNFFAAFADFESGPAWVYIWAIGIPAIVIMGVFAFQVWRYSRST